MAYQKHKLIWQSIEIEIRYAPLKWDVIAHLEIESVSPPRAALPVTETGYLSHHHQPNTIEETHGNDIAGFVADWLNKEAKSPKWQDFLEKSRQGDLFNLLFI